MTEHGDYGNVGWYDVFAAGWRARLAPARDDTSVDCCDCPKCGDWRDSPTADCAACGFAPARDDTSGGAS